MSGLLGTALIYLLAALLMVPLAKRLGLGSVLGYLIAGILIGPAALNLVGDQTNTQHFAEFGVVMMLFIVGLELKPSTLWKLRASILGLGTLQVGVTASILFAVFFIVFGFTWQGALAIGLTLALSSTAIVLTYLNEKKQMSTPAGQSAFAVLLFQDIAVIPMLAIFPMLAVIAVNPVDDSSNLLIEENAHSLILEQSDNSLLAMYEDTANELNDTDKQLADIQSVALTQASNISHNVDDTHQVEGTAFSQWFDKQPGWSKTMTSIGVILAIVMGAHYILRYVFRFIAKSELREMFTVCALFIVVGISFVMGQIGISAALGTFLAGVVLAESEYRHQLETDIEPFKGLLLGLFFITVGASMDFSYLISQPGYIASVTALIIGIKMFVLYVIGRMFKLSIGQNKLFFFSLAQAGEFAFVLFALATQSNILTQEEASPLILIVALTMMLTPLMLIVYERFFAANNNVQTNREPDKIEEENPVLVAGFGRVGQIVVRILQASGYTTTIIEQDADHIEMVKKYGYKAYYGDASSLDLLHSAGIANAKLFVIAIDDKDAVRDIVKEVKAHYPNLKIVARVKGRVEAFELINLGIDHPIRETLSSSVDMAVQALEALGLRKHQAYRHGEKFKLLDHIAITNMASVYQDDALNLVIKTKESRDQLEAILQKEIQENKGEIKNW